LQSSRASLSFENEGDERAMREIADSFMKLLAIIMMMITLAVSTAAVSLIFG
jgi:hypothetical protein